jgi:hypothetical protein
LGYGLGHILVIGHFNVTCLENKARWVTKFGGLKLILFNIATAHCAIDLHKVFVSLLELAWVFDYLD